MTGTSGPPPAGLAVTPANRALIERARRDAATRRATAAAQLMIIRPAGPGRPWRYTWREASPGYATEEDMNAAIDAQFGPRPDTPGAAPPGPPAARASQEGHPAC
jgi:hypothetical protein